MKYVITFLLVFIFSTKILAQGGETKWIDPPSFNLIIGDAVYTEADEQNIPDDQIIVSFSVDEKCQTSDFVVTQGKLKSFGEWAKKNSETIVRELMKGNPCNGEGKKRTIKIPIRAKF